MVVAPRAIHRLPKKAIGKKRKREIETMSSLQSIQSIHTLFFFSQRAFKTAHRKPAYPIVFRNTSEKEKNKERLNLDRRNLTVCPFLQGEENLRLLNYENNWIRKINNLNNLPNLIFLDFYNNKLTEIRNLHNLKQFRKLKAWKTCFF